MRNPLKKREKLHLNVEKNIVTGCIISDVFAKSIRKRLRDLDLIQEKMFRTILSWIFDYVDTYDKAPKDTIMSIFLGNKQKLVDEDLADSIEHVLIHLNERFIEDEESFDVTYQEAQAFKYLKNQSYKAFAARLQACVDAEDPDQADKEYEDFKSVEVRRSQPVDPFDPDFIERLFSEEEKTHLFDIPVPAFKKMIGPIYRGDIMAVAAPAKRGKSFLLQELALYAALDNLNVAIFSYEMEVKVNVKRAFQNLLRETGPGKVQDVKIPEFDDLGNIVYSEVRKDGLTDKKVKRYIRKHKRSGSIFPNLRIFDNETCGRKISDIVEALKDLESQEFKVDVVVIDYDSLLENEPGYKGNEIEANTRLWKDMKLKIASDLHCLVITASQYSRDAINNEAGVQNTAGNIRKFDYVSHWISINQTPIEKELGVMRLDTVGRHDEYNSLNKLVCLQALAMGRPVLDARWQWDIPNLKRLVKDKEKEKGVVDEKQPATRRKVKKVEKEEEEEDESEPRSKFN